jgi:hypothetical protein
MADEQVAVSEQPAAPSVLNASTESIDAETTSDWRSALPEDLRDHQALQNITDVGTLAKTMIHAQSMVGAEKIAVPGRWATDEDWDQVYTKLGRPDDATGYEFDTGEVEMDQDFVGNFREVAHKAGLSGRQAQTLADWYTSLAGEHGPEAQQVNIEASKAEVEAELRKEYGNAFDDRLAIGDNLIDEFGADGLSELKLDSGVPLINHPAFIRTVINAAHYIQENVAEDKMIGDKGSPAMTPAEADKEMQQLMREGSPYWDARHPMHDSTVQEVHKLMQQKHPEENERPGI